MAKVFGGATRRWRRSLDSPRDRWAAWADSLFGDHAVVRFVHRNRARVDQNMWRSAQPAPWDVAWAQGQGVRTIVNLRGERNCGSYLLEREACERLGLTMVDFPLGSREAPSATRLQGLHDLFQSIAYPALLHCKSGADRVGLASALYLHWRGGEPIAEAVGQLSLRHGHIRQGKTGVLDHFFAVFERQAAAGGPKDLLAWSQSAAYDPAAIKADFKASGWGDLLVDRILRRE